MRRTAAAVTLALALVAAPVLAASPAAAARPTATITVREWSIAIGGTSSVTFTFSEAVSGLTADDVTSTAGTISDPTTSDGLEWTAEFTPDPGVTDNRATLVLDNTRVVTNAGGEPGVGTTASNEFAVDTVPPTATVAVSRPRLRAGDTATVTLAFSEPVTALTDDDLTVGGARASGLSSSDGGRNWTATLTPDVDTEASGEVVTLDLAGLQDLRGNAGVGTASSAAFDVDTRRPTATVGLSATTLGIDDSATVTVAFSEPVVGFDTGDLTVHRGTVSALRTTDNVVWTATLVPEAGASVTDQVVTVALSGVMDQAGNVGSGTADSPAYTVDTVRPTGVVTVDRTVVRAGETAAVTLTFSEPVSGVGGASGPALAAGGGTVTAPTSADGGRTWTATFTPTAGARASAVLTLDLTSVADAAGNVGTGTAPGPSIDVRTTRPTATVSVSEPVLTATTDAVLTLTFSEPVSVGLWRALSTPGASVPVLTSTDGDRTWTGPLRGAAGTESGPAVVTLDLAQLVNGDGNAGVGTVTSAAYAVDTVRPTATLALAAARVTGPTTLTVTFSEPVATLAPTDLVAEAGTLSGLATADGGLTWTATYTPDAGARAGAATIRLALAGVADLAGNTGVGAVLSVPFAVEATAAPAPATPVPSVPVAVAPVAVAPVVAPAAAVPATPSATLPRTGSEAGPALVVAAGLLLAGAAAVGARSVARSRRGRA